MSFTFLNFLRFLFFLIFVGFSVLSGASKKPNILLIVTDDQSPLTLSCYGNTVCDTPHLDKLAASGIVLDQAYHMGSMRGAVCSPSRTMIMSGRTLWHLPPRGKKHRKIEEGITGGKTVMIWLTIYLPLLWTKRAAALLKKMVVSGMVKE